MFHKIANVVALEEVLLGDRVHVELFDLGDTMYFLDASFGSIWVSTIA